MAAFGLFVARNLTVREVRGNTVVETPFGSIRVREGTGSDLRFAGLPVYPGATRVGGKGKMASLEFDLGDSREGFSVIAAEYTTADPAGRVAEFYRRNLGNWTYKQNSRGFVKMESSQGGRKRVVGIQERDGVTHIGLASVGEPESN
jgi:hypothetical protein